MTKKKKPLNKKSKVASFSTKFMNLKVHVESPIKEIRSTKNDGTSMLVPTGELIVVVSCGGETFRFSNLYGELK